MPRRLRLSTGGLVFHVLNRATGRRCIFESVGDYDAFEIVLHEAKQRTPMRILVHAIMPTHWHLVLWPERDGDLSTFMHWLTLTHTQRWHAFHATSGTGPLYQGRFKAIPVQTDDHLLTVNRYVERNALRAQLVARAEDWRWSSLWRRCRNLNLNLLDPWPIPPPADWVQIVNRPHTEGELASIRRAIVKGAPFGDPSWTSETAARLRLESALRDRGRPLRKKAPDHFWEMTPDPFFSR